MNRLLKTVHKSAVAGSRLGHTLVVPYVHAPIVKFQDGIPAEQVRELTDFEKKWEFWTTSTSFYLTTPKTRGVVAIPPGESWIIERFGSFNRVLTTGTHLILPFIESVRTVKVNTLATLGVFAPGVASKDGTAVDVYAVAYYKVVDPQASAYFVDPETNKLDSERSAAKTIKHALAAAASEYSATLTASDKTAIASKVLAKIQQKQDEYGLKFETVEIRGNFPVEQNVPAKIRAYDPPYPDFDAPGHDLSADYWNEYLTPMYFKKIQYGSHKTPETPNAVSLEWSIPSPPDFHHFNHLPRVTQAPEIEELEKLGIKHH
ncbi:band 7 family-domain-containing protein [Globomyces pollinis-pini]|nr:band 7 family-domain-containing protein [Globomyces pollinis-pini]